MALTVPSTAAEDSYRREPDATLHSVAANRGTFATANTSVARGFGLDGERIHYPTDTRPRIGSAVAAVPGHTATWAAEGAWIGHREPRR